MSRILIVGASDGIGLELAKAYLEEGNEVCCIARRDCPVAGVTSYRADVADEAQRQAALRYLTERDKLPHTFVYSAGTSICAPAEYTKDEDMRYLWEVNYFGFVRMAQALLPHLEQVKGKIVAVGSMAAVAPIPFDAHYSATKAALNAFAAVLAEEAKPYGVWVTVVLPGGTATGFSFKRKAYGEEDCGKYYAEAKKAAYTLGKMEQTGMTPEKCAELMKKHIDGGTGLYYPVGWENGATYALCKVLPQGAKDRAIRYLYATDKNE
ncbi:MAG: SDR family NAD(P)-dependent oxidoreductase [Clostridia bacterium]|nr:SDR family NAD(P)-dependent oxidoreductase [Clostridia bacterium]